MTSLLLVLWAVVVVIPLVNADAEFVDPGGKLGLDMVQDQDGRGLNKWSKPPAKTAFGTHPALAGKEDGSGASQSSLGALKGKKKPIY